MSQYHTIEFRDGSIEFRFKPDEEDARIGLEMIDPVLKESFTGLISDVVIHTIDVWVEDGLLNFNRI